MVKVAELWEWLTWLRGRSSLLRTTSWTLTQVGLEVSKVEVTFRNRRESGGPVRRSSGGKEHRLAGEPRGLVHLGTTNVREAYEKNEKGGARPMPVWSRD